ncbi:FtsW/RodA/SpoVE family cell cycle protein [Thermoflavifilum thermophilum]|uniref:Probable peptidoglycan glycosyltransferase FtsW n=1 Tax=Thermoflavifilum thermophilum TaxID=1393122 RepID=A0A1I7N492_9BACT|nr:FtsW/RodA/SpoVE family cell cycle protein [Thermoflavifilum thermophilum]SFV29489.1 cell division protein FtsW [Thermoflavifilum thermophilum]
MKQLMQQIRGDKVIWGVVIMLSLISMLAVYSSTGMLAYRMQHGHNEYYLFKQVSVLLFGLLIIYLSHRVHYMIYARVAKIGVIIAVPLLIYTLLFGSHVNDASRWIRLPVINLTFQTSDFARLALFMYVSLQLARHQEEIKDFHKGYKPVLVAMLVICGLIAPANLSTALLLGASCFLLCFIGRVALKHLMITLLVVALPLLILMGIAALTYHPDDQLHTFDRRQRAWYERVIERVEGKGRIATWIHRVQDFMFASHEDVPYQVEQAKIAIARGGLLGKGPGNSIQRNFLPYPYSDFIFAIIIEEYGLVGAALLIMLYLILLFRCIRLFRRCPYAFGSFLCIGLSFTLVIQAFANMGVAVNLLPVTGVTLPLVSMGGSSIWFTSLSIGIILSVARYMEKEELEKQQLSEVEESWMDSLESGNVASMDDSKIAKPLAYES